MNGEQATIRLVRTQDGYYEIQPKPTPEELKAFYNERYFGSGDGRNQYSCEYTDDELAHKRIEAAEALAYAPSGGTRLFEVGCGEGFTLDEFHRRGWQVKGVDFTSHGVETCFPHLLDLVMVGDVYGQLETEIESGDRYDLVLCNHVLEHVVDPPELLGRLRQLLTGNGVCRVQVPNDGSWLQREAVTRGHAEPEYWVVTPDHLSYFAAESLRRLLQRTGWEVIEMLATFPIDLFLLNPDSCYTREHERGRNCHFARVAFELGLWRQSPEALIEFRRGCARAGTGRDLIAYVRPRD